MTFGWGGGGGRGRISDGSGFYLSSFCCYFEQAHFMFVSGLLFVLFVKLLVVFEKLKL